MNERFCFVSINVIRLLVTKFLYPIAFFKSQEVPELVTEACHLSSKQLEELMDDDCCNGPVSNGDPMLSSPHLSPNDVMGSSPASSISGAASHYSSNGDDCTNGLSPDSMDLTAA